MLQLRNRSPFEATMFGLPDVAGVETLFIVVQATFLFGDPPALAPEQHPIPLADVYWGEPRTSSLRYPSAVGLAKPGADVIVLGEACSPGLRPVPELELVVALGLASARVRVLGERVWTQTLRGVQPTAPEPFARMPLRYERAFGGRSPDPSAQVYAHNPVGRGFLGQASPELLFGHPVPNFEDPQRALSWAGQVEAPVGVGPIAPSWAPRASHAGSYDTRWRRERAPYLPEDFDPRFFQVAPAALQLDQPLLGGEPLTLRGFDPERHWSFALPRCELELHARIRAQTHAIQPRLELIVLEPGERRLLLRWRGCRALGRDTMLDVSAVKVALTRLDGVAATPGASS